MSAETPRSRWRETGPILAGLAGGVARALPRFHQVEARTFSGAGFALLAVHALSGSAGGAAP